MGIIKQILGHVGDAVRHKTRLKETDHVLRQAFQQKQRGSDHHQRQRLFQGFGAVDAGRNDADDFRRVVKRQPHQKLAGDYSAEVGKKQQLLPGKIVPEKNPHRRRDGFYFHFFFLCFRRVSLSLTIAVSRPVLARRSYMRSISFSR